jgi:colanic acid biosynthesis glycosyl transferase WcaI
MVYKEVKDDLNVIRARTLLMPRYIPVLRGMEQIISAITYFLIGWVSSEKKFDVVLIYSPPLFLGITAKLLSLVKNAKLVVNIQDLFPQSAIDLGVLKSSLLIKILRKMESYIYRSADMIAVHSEGNRSHVISCGGSESNTNVVENPVDTVSIVPGERNNNFRRTHGIKPEQIVISFAVVLGYSQDLDIVIEAAKKIKDHEKIIFYIVGDGVEKPRLMEKAQELQNVRFLPMIPKEQYAELLHASDICLVTLHSTVKTPVVPSKILSIMAAGRPLIAALPLNGDAPVIINNAQCGICIEPENSDLMAQTILDMVLKGENLETMGKQGRSYVEQHFSLQQCATKYETIFKSFLSKH